MAKYITIFLTLTMLMMGKVVIADEYAADHPITCEANPNLIKVGTFYHGTNVQVTAKMPRCDGAVILLMGKGNNIELNRKERVAGIWLNVAHVTVNNAPEFYFLAKTDKLDDLCSRKLQEQLELGITNLRKRITFESSKNLKGNEFEEFLKLKIHNKSYDTTINITVEPIDDNYEKLSTVFYLPSAIPSGDYTIWIYCFDQKELINKASVQITIEKVGLPAIMRKLAFKHAALYGLLAIVVAMMTGIIMGVVFSSKYKGKH